MGIFTMIWHDKLARFDGKSVIAVGVNLLKKQQIVIFTET